MRHAIATGLVLLLTITSTVRAAADEAMDAIATKAARAAIEAFPDEKIADDQIAVTVIDLRDADHPRTGSFRGDKPTYPASVVKLFYLVATHQWMEDGRLKDSDELRRTMHDMIVDSANDATGMIVDALSDAINGPPLPDDEMKAWIAKRTAVNRYFASLGYAVGGANGINVCQKTYAEGPYGRERIFINSGSGNRNRLTTDATAKLLSQIALGKAVSAERSKQMLELLKRDPTTKPAGGDDQNTGFSAAGVPAGSKLWSKAGWVTSQRHDAAYIETPDGVKAVVVTFTSNHSRQRQIIPTVVKTSLESLKNFKPALTSNP
jgi:beta-lactamase class A